jgi:hypothetical protein
VTHEALTVDGTRFAFSATHSSLPSAGTNEFTVALQLDGNKLATPYNLYVDKMTISYR